MGKDKHTQECGSEARFDSVSRQVPQWTGGMTTQLCTKHDMTIMAMTQNTCGQVAS
jgi:hypothetical protein